MLGLLPGISSAQTAYYLPPGLSPPGRANYAMMQGANVQQALPYLGSYYRILSAQSDRYNAYSHTIGDYSRWVDPGQAVRDFDLLYARYGFQRLPYPRYEHAAGQQKIVLYGKLREDGSLAVTSASRQEASGYTTKLGTGPLIWHPYAQSLVGPLYGQPIAVYVRSR